MLIRRPWRKESTEPTLKDRFVVHTLAGFKIEGISVGGQETCIILPQLKLAFDSGRCPQRLVYADTLCLSHTHMDHVGGRA
jgi:ribonuclease Z